MDKANQIYTGCSLGKVAEHAMPQKVQAHSNLSSPILPLAAIGLALAILGGTIAYAAYDLRSKSRSQITGQHAQILYALWLSQKSAEFHGLESNTEEQPSDHVPAVLEMAQLPLSQLDGLLGMRLFDADGHSLFVDAHVTEAALARRDLEALRALKPLARLRASADAGEVDFMVAESGMPNRPLLDVYVPLHSPGRERLVGVAQFLMDGTGVAEEFRQLDRNLAVQAGLNLVVGGGLLGGILWLGFRQLQRVNRLLRERTERLLRANEELALAAKTSAVGAVTAHLIHGLKNPLSGLQTFVASRGNAVEQGEETDWQLAVSTARRMQSMIHEIVRVIQEEHGESQYEMSLQEFADMLSAKVQPLAQEAGVEFEMRLGAETLLQNREANLISLVLYNLLQNAFQATPKGRLVSLSFAARGERIVCEVKDQGAGISEAQRAGLFKPCRSAKEGGSGIGLAISQQLAKCIGADLELKETGPDGSVFVLVFAGRGQLSQSNAREGECAG